MDTATTTTTPIGYAVIEERDGEYSRPDPTLVRFVGAVDPVSGHRWDDHDARVEAQARATTLNDNDAETPYSWRVVALVPVA